MTNNLICKLAGIAAATAAVIGVAAPGAVASTTLWERAGVIPGTQLEQNLIHICSNQGGSFHKHVYYGVSTIETVWCTR